jgi:hypothetical protein
LEYQKRDVMPGEHLDKLCACGYVWQEPTRDATAKELEVVP